MPRKTVIAAREVKAEVSPARVWISSYSLVVALVVALLIALAVAGYFYYQYKHVVPAAPEADEIENLTKAIGDVLELPAGETPTLATVTDREKLAEQPFFQRAENGDKVLIYSASGRAILYRPSTKKIVDMTTVNVNTNQAPETTPAAQEQAPLQPVGEQAAPAATAPVVTRIALYNGSTTVGATNGMEAQIKQVFTDTAVVSKDKASRSDYSGNVIVDLSGKNAEFAKSLSESLGGVVGTLPAGESVPEADVLIIVGNK